MDALPRDWPLRAVQLDLARQMETLDYLRRYCDFIHAHGFNTLFLYLEGRVRTASFPYRPAANSYSPEDLAGIVRHAAELGVQVVPGLATVGHAELFLTCPELTHLAEEREGDGRFGRGGPSTFCPSQEETYAFLERYLTEIAAIFPAPYLHLGGDEAWNLGFCPLCRPRRECDGLGALYTAHLLRLAALCTRLGKRPWLWDDMYELFPAELARVPKDFVMCHWNYDDWIAPEGARAHFLNRWRHDWLATYERLGLEALICPVATSPANVESFTAYAARHRVLGGLLTQWEGSLRFLPEAAPAIAATGRLWQQPLRAGAGPDVWAEGVAAVFPGLPPPVAAAVTTLVRTPRTWSGVPSPGLLDGPLSSSERQRREAVTLALEVLTAARRQGVFPPAAPAAATTAEDLESGARLDPVCWELRDLAPAIADPRRAPATVPLLAARLDQAAAQLAALRDVRVRLEGELRPGLSTAGTTAAWFDRLNAGLAVWRQRLAREPDDQDWWLVLRLFLPDGYGAPRVQVSCQCGAETRVLLAGGRKPTDLDQPYYTVRLPFRSATAPETLRCEVWGHGGQGIAFAEFQHRSRTLVPVRVLTVAGPVRDAEAVLRDDSAAAYLGYRDIRPLMDHPALAEERAIIELAVGEPLPLA